MKTKIRKRYFVNLPKDSKVFLEYNKNIDRYIAIFNSGTEKYTINFYIENFYDIESKDFFVKDVYGMLNDSCLSGIENIKIIYITDIDIYEHAAFYMSNFIETLINYFDNKKYKSSNLICIARIGNYNPYISNMDNIFKDCMCNFNFYSNFENSIPYVAITKLTYKPLFNYLSIKLHDTIKNKDYCYNKLATNYDELRCKYDNLNKSNNDKTQLINNIVNAYRNDLITSKLAAQLLGISVANLYKKYKKKINKGE